jgi:hypothetical protein
MDVQLGARISVLTRKAKAEEDRGKTNRWMREVLVLLIADEG